MEGITVGDESSLERVRRTFWGETEGNLLKTKTGIHSHKKDASEGRWWHAVW